MRVCAIDRLTEEQRIGRYIFVISILEGDDVAVGAYHDWLVDQGLSDSDIKFFDPFGWIKCRNQSYTERAIVEFKSELEHFKRVKDLA